MKLLFRVVEVTRLLSSIIKGQRIRSESWLEIENTSTNKNIAPENKDENLATNAEEQEIYIEQKLQSAQSKAEMIMKEATEEAAAKAALIIKEGQDRIEREAAIALEQAHEKGYTLGYEKGQLEAKALIDQGNQIIQDAKKERQQILDDIEAEVIEMIIKICQNLIDEEINYNKDTIRFLIRKTLGKASTDALEFNIKVSEADYDYVIENKDEIVENAAAPSDVTITKDVNLTQGACTVETEFGSIGCSVDQAFTEIKKQMRLISNKK